MEDTSKHTIMALTPKNFHWWIREVESFASDAKVWKYVDPDGNTDAPDRSDPPKFSDYIVQAPADEEETASSSSAPTTRPASVTRPARKYSELSPEQQQDYKMNTSAYKLEETRFDRTYRGIRLVKSAVFATARAYIPSTKLDQSLREILKLLASRYRRPNEEIIDQIHESYMVLKIPPPKSKIDAWINDWKNIKNLMMDMGIAGNPGFEIIFVKDFLMAGRTWAPSFCDSWLKIRRNAGKSIDFTEATREYRLAVKSRLSEMKKPQS